MFCRYHYNLAQDAQIASSGSGEKINFAVISRRSVYATSLMFQWYSLCFSPFSLVFLQVAIPHTSLLLPGKAVVAGEVAGAVLGILEQVSPTDDSLPGRYSVSVSACGMTGYATCPHSQKCAQKRFEAPQVLFFIRYYSFCLCNNFSWFQYFRMFLLILVHRNLNYLEVKVILVAFLLLNSLQ